MKGKDNSLIILAGLAGAYLLFSGKGAGIGNEGGSFVAPSVLVPSGETSGTIISSGSTKKENVSTLIVPSFLPGKYSYAPQGSTSGAFQSDSPPLSSAGYTAFAAGLPAGQLTAKGGQSKKQAVQPNFNQFLPNMTLRQ